EVAESGAGAYRAVPCVGAARFHAGRRQAATVARTARRDRADARGRRRFFPWPQSVWVDRSVDPEILRRFRGGRPQTARSSRDPIASLITESIYTVALTPGRADQRA